LQQQGGRLSEEPEKREEVTFHGRGATRREKKRYHTYPKRRKAFQREKERKAKLS